MELSGVQLFIRVTQVTTSVSNWLQSLRSDVLDFDHSESPTTLGVQRPDTVARPRQERQAYFDRSLNSTLTFYAVHVSRFVFLTKRALFSLHFN